MKYNYTAIRDQSSPPGTSRKYIKLPLLAFTIAIGERQTTLVGLIDTGASDCLFDKDIADDLGIDLKATSVIRHYVGIDGQAVTGYVHQVSIQIAKFSEWIEIEAGFLDCPLPCPLLGQSGFFDNYEITLRRYRGKFEIKSRTYL